MRFLFSGKRMLRLYACEQEAQWQEPEVQGDVSGGSDGRPGMYGRPSRAKMGTVSDCEELVESGARWSHMW